MSGSSSSSIVGRGRENKSGKDGQTRLTGFIRESRGISAMKYLVRLSPTNVRPYM
ncbi:Hypothetical protein FKW44_020591 [Caligus rogercresseyi]|uniref:Uncharacterized protein n=1 Tax=Caligus rogercresseyi TaxID=217165 RepID=A0A7T8GXG9_CALRO|nr:Hypothetical protein FKW44_020591 [Caligus rogercresseyi]